jgi:hypothetical protein
MSGDESFLARWSRRKRNVAARSVAEKHPPSAAEIAKPASPTTGDAPPAMPLPPTESIESASDIKVFPAPDVPLELTRAALRRAWAADPAIRDFIGLSENAWDFNAPDGVPGFGSLDLEELRRLAAQVMEEPQVADSAPAVANDAATPAEAAPAVSMIASRQSIAAPQNKNEQGKARESRPRHRHGGALPQ